MRKGNEKIIVITAASGWYFHLVLGYKWEFKNEFDLAFLKKIVLKKQGGTYSRLTLLPHIKNKPKNDKNRFYYEKQ